jgi:hypothetical protein
MSEKSENMDLETAIQGPQDLDPILASLVEVTVTQPEELIDDEICLSIKEDEIPDAVLKAVILGLAEEQLSLKTLRKKKQGEGKDSSSISLRRGTLLKYMSETLLQRQALTGFTGEMDLRGPRFREVFKMLLNIVADTFDEIKAPAEYKEMFFHALSRNLEGWEECAEKLIKAMTPRMK